MDFEDLPQPGEPELASVTRPGLSSVTTNCNQNAVCNTVCFDSELELLLLHWHPAYNSNFLLAGGCRYKRALLYQLRGGVVEPLPTGRHFLYYTESHSAATLLAALHSDQGDATG